jgi:ubiquinone/menaquinone biosynthesis C-methylase UbiE
MWINDAGRVADYNAWQKRYAEKMRESDRVLLGLIAANGVGTSLLDIGCSTGNLLLHLRRAFPQLKLTGGDIVDASLDEARRNPELSSVDLRHMDIMEIDGKYDMIVANAVAVYFDWPDYERALQSVFRALNPGGVYFAWEWLTPHNQDLQIRERCLSNPNGLTYFFRAYSSVGRVLESVGFTDVEFNPFEMPFPLPEPADKSGDTITYTKDMADGRRLAMRGTLAQPWCHLVARKR